MTAALTVEECQEHVQKARRSNAIYAIAENYILFRECLMVEELVARADASTLYFANGEHLHELKELNKRTPWQRQWQTEVNGITCGTHSLDPILRWMSGDRVERATCRGSGR